MEERRRIVVDAFPFYNELAMLEYRLAMLKHVADYHVIVEATKTYAGNPKPLFYESNKDLFEEYSDKIIHVVVDDMPDGDDPWQRENFQRDAGIPRGMEKIEGLGGRDLLIVSDVDEIPNPATIAALRETHGTGFVRLVQDLYYFEAKDEFFWSTWKHAVVSDVETASRGQRLSIARTDGCFGETRNGGWHLSYFLPGDLVVRKMREFAHQEDAIQIFANSEHVGRAARGETALYERPKTGEKPSAHLPPGVDSLKKRIQELAHRSRSENYS